MKKTFLHLKNIILHPPSLSYMITSFYKRLYNTYELYGLGHSYFKGIRYEQNTCRNDRRYYPVTNKRI